VQRGGGEGGLKEEMNGQDRVGRRFLPTHRKKKFVISFSIVGGGANLGLEVEKGPYFWSQIGQEESRYRRGKE